MKWLIVEDALRDRKGHWLEYVSTFVRELRALGDEVVVLCDRKAQGFVIEQTGARPVLPESIWRRMGDGAGALKRYLRVPGHAWATFVAVRKVFRELFSAQPATIYPIPATSRPPDWIFVPTVLVHHLLGWWLLLKTGSVLKEARVLLFFPNLPIRLDNEGHPHWYGGPTKKLMAWLFASLRKDVESGWVVMGVETHAMRRALEGLIGMPVVYLPHPVPAKPALCGASDRGGFPAEAQRRGDFLTTIERLGGRENRKLGKAEERATESCPQRGAASGTMQVNEQPKVGLTGERVGTTESNETDLHGWGTTNHTKLHERGETGQCLPGQAGAAFSNPSTSELAQDSEKASLTRYASGTDSLPATSYSLPATLAKPIIFGCYGAARWEKGSDIFQEAIKLILKNEVASKKCRVASVEDKSNPVTHYSLPATTVGRPLRFAIQWVEDFRDDSGNLVSIDPWLLEHPQVEVIGRYFEGDEYEQRLTATDVMVLPYRSPYRLRVSRVVIEAMLNGMPVIATRGTTLFKQAEEYGVVIGCEEGDAESLAQAMLEVAGRFEMLRASAEDKANAAAESFSVGHFRDLLHSKMSITCMSPS